MKAAEDRFKQVLFTCLTIFIFSFAEGQSLKDHLQKGDRYYQRKDYEKALDYYLQALALDGNDARTNFKAGISSLNIERYAEAAKYLEKAFELKPDVDSRIHYHLGMAYQENHAFTKAREHFEAFKRNYKSLAGVADQKITASILADSLMRIPSKARVRTLDEINTSFTEVFPLLSGDGKKFIFTSNRSSDEYEIKSATNFEDVYVSEQAGYEWAAPEKIGANINVKLNEAAVYWSPDGKRLLLYYEEGGGDIHSATFENGEWSAPVALNQFVNHPHYREMSACISPDGTKLYFSSNRPGGKGGYDIYVCQLTAKGDWGRPSNLGSVINTRGDEESPYLHADGVSLYFSSNGHATIGNHDIYKSTFTDDRWSAPEHLGHPINSRGYDGNFVLSQDGKTAYFSSRRGNVSGMDIYQATFSSSASGAKKAVVSAKADQPSSANGENKIVTVLKGTVIDAKRTAPLEATIRLVDNVNKIIVSTVQTGPSGSFELVIPHGGNFGVTTQRPGYLFNSMNFELPDFEKYQEIETHILMVKAEVGSKVVLKNIFFDVNDSALKPESLSELQNIRDLLVQNPGWRIQINGHTDNTGDPKANMALSLKRAESVVQYLIKEGVSPDRLKAKGYGSERPLVSNDDEKDGRQINRRTEIEIIE